MSQELNICHYYLLVLFDFEAAQWPVSAGFIPPPSVVRFKVDYSNPRAPDSAKSRSFLSFARSFFLSLSLPPPRSTLLNEITYICWLRVSQMSTHSPVSAHTSTRLPFVVNDAAAQHSLSGGVCVWLKTTRFSWFSSIPSSRISHLCTDCDLIQHQTYCFSVNIVKAFGWYAYSESLRIKAKDNEITTLHHWYLNLS